jgi:peroxiredoxin Q/BCP
LPFPLIADINHELLETMGAWGEKSMYGKKVMGTIRTTFIINEEGIIEQIFAGKQVKTKEHAEQILGIDN